MKRARHRFWSDVIVTWSLGKDCLGGPIVKVRFSSGETTTMSVAQFHDTFEVL